MNPRALIPLLPTLALLGCYSIVIVNTGFSRNAAIRIAPLPPPTKKGDTRPMVFNVNNLEQIKEAIEVYEKNPYPPLILVLCSRDHRCQRVVFDETSLTYQQTDPTGAALP